MVGLTAWFLVGFSTWHVHQHNDAAAAAAADDDIVEIIVPAQTAVVAATTTKQRAASSPLPDGDKNWGSCIHGISPLVSRSMIETLLAKAASHSTTDKTNDEEGVFRVIMTVLADWDHTGASIPEASPWSAVICAVMARRIPWRGQ